MLRGSARIGDTPASAQAAWGVKLRGEWGGRVEAALSSRTAYSTGNTPSIAASTAYYGRKYLGKLVLGDYSMRLGQGLLGWSGFVLAPYSGVNSLRRSPTGFSLSGAFETDMHGVAADFDFGRWSAGAAWSVRGNVPAGFVTYTSRTMSASLNATSRGVSCSWQLGLPSLSLYGELAWTGRIDAVCGLMWVPKYSWKFGALARRIDGVNEIIAAGALPQMDAVIALSNKQFRLMYKYAPTVRCGAVELRPLLRLAARRNPAWRLEARGEFEARSQALMVKVRADAVHCRSLSMLAYAEAGKCEGKLTAYLRFTAFAVDNWDDRIWVYERDAPGNFNVPAYCGRGWAASAAAAFKPSRRHSLYLRVSLLRYPWMSETKEGRSEVRLQYQLKL